MNKKQWQSLVAAFRDARTAALVADDYVIGGTHQVLVDTIVRRVAERCEDPELFILVCGATVLKPK
jgi:hypothetical protein